MKIIVKYLWQSLMDRKGRALLVLFSIAASASLMFANEGFRRTTEYMFYEADTRHAGNSDIRISVKQEKGASEWIDDSVFMEYTDELDYANSFLYESALYAPNVEDMYYFHLYGVNMDEWQQHNPFELKEGSFGDWSGYQIIIGEIYAAKYGFSVGDTITLEMNGQTCDFIVAGIAKQQGIYLRELADGGTLFAPRQTVAKIFGGETNLMYIKVRDQSNLEAVKNQLSERFSDYQVIYTLDKKLIEAETSNSVLPFRISSVAVIFMSIFIIYTGFGLITTERIAVIGTLRSLGATRKRVNRILAAESAVIGAVGGAFGCFLGIGILYFIKSIYFQDNGSFAGSAPMLFGVREILTAILSAVVITTGSAMFSIRKCTKLSIKDVILHRLEQRITKNTKLWIPGIFLTIACILVPQFLPITLPGMIISCILAVGALVGLITLIPVILHLAVKASERSGLSQEVVLGIRNIKDHKALSGNLKLFAAIIALVAYMVSIFNTMSTDLHTAWDKYYLYDVSMELQASDEKTLGRIQEVEGVTTAIGFYTNYNSYLADSGMFFSMIGITDASYFEMNPMGGLAQARKAIDTLSEGSNIITTEIVKSKLGLKLGDKLRVTCDDREMTFTITAFVDTNTAIGHIGYISQENLKKLAGSMYQDEYQVKGSISPDQLKINLKRELTRSILTISTKQELRNANADKVDSIFKSINIYTYFAVAVGMLGLLNNIMSGYLERKRSLALYRCIGMSKKGISRMLMTEAIVVSLLGSLLGMLTALVMMTTIPKTVGMMWGNVKVCPAVTEMTILGVAGLLVMAFISALPLRSGRDLSIMDSMRYE